MNGALARALRGAREHTYLFVVSTGVIAAALVLIGMFAMVSTNLTLILGSWERDVHVSAYLASGTPDSHAAVVQTLATRPEVAEAVYVSAADAQKWMEERTPELAPVLADLGADALPASIEITLKPAYTTPEAMRAFVTSLQGAGPFEDVDYGQEWIARVDTFLSILDALGVALGTFIAIAALFLVGNTIHLVVHSRRDELEIMRLVGATDSHILLPFVLEGAVQGLLASAAATTLLYGAHRGLLSRLEPVLALALSGRGLEFLPVWSVLLMTLGGVALGALASAATVTRFLRTLR